MQSLHIARVWGQTQEGFLLRLYAILTEVVPIFSQKETNCYGLCCVCLRFLYSG